MRKHPIITVPQRRSGFTLVELMIVVSIILLLATITLVSVNFSYSRDRVRAAGRQLQSFIAGARDRAIYQKEVRGVRLILDPANTHTAVAVQYVGAPDRWTEGFVTLYANDVVSVPSGLFLQSNGLLAVGTQIEIPKDSGAFFTVASVAIADPNISNNGLVKLNRGVPVFTALGQTTSFSLLLKPMLLPGSEPVPFPPGVVIDLDGSNLPSSWRPGIANTGQSYSSTMDILFNPRGSVTGDVAGNGILHLLLADAGDVILWSSIPGRIQKANPTSTEWSPPIVPANGAAGTPIVRKDQIIVSLNGRSGNVSVHQVNPTNISPADLVADDPYSFAETGQVSNQ